ncbi:MAG: Mur ligase family protein [Pirellulales bacterium]|nr:Mur ligase family protein [Pirellulales bacterium]
MARSHKKSHPEISLRTLFPRAGWQHCQDIVCRRAVRRPAEIRSGDLYAVFETEDVDSLAGAVQARQFGATALLVEQLLPLDVPQCIVPNVPAAYARVRQALAGDPAEVLSPIAVVGSLGKTVASWLISGVLGESAVCGFRGTLGCSDGTEFVPGAGDGDWPADTALWLAACVKAKATHAVMEVPFAALARQELAGLGFSAICLTNLFRHAGEDHAAWARSRENFTAIMNFLRAGGTCVANIDDPFCRELSQTRGVPVLTVALGRTADVTARLLERSLAEQTFLLTAGAETVPVRTRLTGDAHLEACLLAAGVGLLRGLSLVEIARGLETVEQIPGRWERIEAGQPFGVFVDAANNAESLNSTLESLRGVTAGRLITVFGTNGGVPLRQRARIGQTLEAMSDLVVMTDGWHPTDDSAALVLDLLKGCESLEQVVRKPDRAHAIRWALAEARPGDVVLVAGPDNGPFPGVEGGDLSRDDREVIHSWLAEYNRHFPLVATNRQSAAKNR